MRIWARLCIVGAVLLLVAAAGCKSTGGGGSGGSSAGRGHPTYFEADPAFAPEGTIRIPVLGFANATEEAEAVGYFYPHLEAAWAEKPQYVFVSKWTVQRDARRKNMKPQVEELEQQWRDDRAFDPDLLKQFGEAFTTEYVMGGWINEWSETQIDRNVEGYSHSDVEAGLQIIRIADNTVVWESRDRLEMKSAHWDPSARDQFIAGEAVQSGSQALPQPPPINEVASRVAVNLVSVLP
jgi:hypothetical protein